METTDLRRPKQCDHGSLGRLPLTVYTAHANGQKNAPLFKVL